MIPNRKHKRQALRHFCYEKCINHDDKQKQQQQWFCCNAQYDNKASLGRHIQSCHDHELLQLENQLAKIDQQQRLDRQQSSTLTKRRVEKGTSDPIHIQCDCNQNEHRVILFYQYVQVDDPETVANLHLEKCGGNGWDLTGKVRIANEGLNVTLAGSLASVNAYMDWYEQQLQQFLSPPGIGDKSRDDFFKPSKGCRHVFSDQLSVKTVDEICPLRQTSITLHRLTQEEHKQYKLSPSDFHQLATMVVNLPAKLSPQQSSSFGTTASTSASVSTAASESAAGNQDTVLLDTRNYYESRIGQFKNSITPPIRKFSVFPSYVDHHRQSLNGKTILTYCTGGIRCEKATAYLRQTLSADTQIYMLDGGIHQYLNWVEQHPEVDPLWQGKNYVFDARQGMGLSQKTLSSSSSSPKANTIISHCQECQTPWDTYQKCQSELCHLLVLHCDTCRLNSKGVSFCCQECQLGLHLQKNGGTGICACERTRKLQELEPMVLRSSIV